MSPVKEQYPGDPYSQPGELPLSEQPKADNAPKPVLDFKDLKSWWEKIRIADSVRKEQLEKKYDEAINYYKSKQFPNAIKNDDKVVVNYIMSTFRIIANTVYNSQPDYKLKAKNPIGELTTPIAEQALNYYTKEIEVEDENRLIVLDMMLAGEGVSLEGHSSQFVYAVKPKEEKDQPVLVNDNDITKLDTEKKRPDDIEYSEYMKVSTPISFRISPKDFIRDTSAKSLKKARWCGRHIYKKPIDDVLDNSMYRSKALKKLDTSMGRGDKTVDLIEIQEKRRINGEIVLYRLVLCEQLQDDFLYYDKEVYKGEGFNYIIAQPNKLGDDVYAISEFQILQGTQDQLNQIHSKIWEQISKSMIQTGINEDYLAKGGKAALLKGEGVIRFKGVSDVRAAITQVETSRVHPDLYKYEQLTRDIFRLTSGIGEAMRAGSQPGADTLGENQLIQGGTNVTLSGFGKTVRKFLVDQGKKRLQIIRQFCTEEQYLPIMGDVEGIPKELVQGKFFKFSSNYIKGEYDVDVDIDAMKIQNEEVERAQFERMIGTLVQLVPGLAQEGKRLNYTELAKGLLKRYNKYNQDVFIKDLKLRTADEEDLAIIAMAKTGNIQPFDIQDGEDLDEHLRKHLEFGQSPLRQLVTPEVWMQVVEPHIKVTLEAVEAKKKKVQEMVQK